MSYLTDDEMEGARIAVARRRERLAAALTAAERAEELALLKRLDERLERAERAAEALPPVNALTMTPEQFQEHLANLGAAGTAPPVPAPEHAPVLAGTMNDEQFSDYVRAVQAGTAPMPADIPTLGGERFQRLMGARHGFAPAGGMGGARVTGGHEPLPFVPPYKASRPQFDDY